MEQLSRDNYRYTLIISQYYHSYHYFIVGIPNDVNYLQTLREFTIELDTYKGEKKEGIGARRSDPFYYKEPSEIRHRYNVNSNGDIYFLNFCTCNEAQEFIQKNIEETKWCRQGYKKKIVLEKIKENHNYWKVRAIVEKHFIIA